MDKIISDNNFVDFTDNNKDLTIEELKEKFSNQSVSVKTINYYQELVRQKRNIEIQNRITEITNALKLSSVAFEKIEYDKQENCIKVY